MSRGRNGVTRRWLLVAGLAATLGAAPAAVAALPTTPSPVSAPQLLARINASGPVGWSGYAQSVGGLALPVTTQFSDLVDLVGSTTQLRAWWRSADSYRVDVLSAVGERDLTRDSDGTWSWDYQAATATRTEVSPTVSVRLPTAADLLPPELGRRLLSQALPSEVTRLPVVRIGGIAAPGLRLRPTEAQTTIDHVDVWADPTTGLPLRVAVYATGLPLPAVSSSFLDVRVATPSAARVAFHPPPGTKVAFQNGTSNTDIASAIERFSHARPPATLAGLSRNNRTPKLGAIGVYGRGVTELVAVPLPNRIAGSLRGQLSGSSAAVRGTDGSVTIAAGPLGLLLTAPATDGRSWLLSGTVTAATLRTAATELTGSAA